MAAGRDSNLNEEETKLELLRQEILTLTNEQYDDEKLKKDFSLPDPKSNLPLGRDVVLIPSRKSNSTDNILVLILYLKYAIQTNDSIAVELFSRLYEDTGTEQKQLRENAKIPLQQYLVKRELEYIRDNIFKDNKLKSRGIQDTYDEFAYHATPPSLQAQSLRQFQPTRKPDKEKTRPLKGQDLKAGVRSKNT